MRGRENVLSVMSRGLYAKGSFTGPAHHSEEQERSAEELMFLCRLSCENFQSITEAQKRERGGKKLRSC